MYLEGGQLEGFKYGTISPLDFSGLEAWYRATDGITFASSNRVAQWNDLSGNNRHLQSINRTSYIPIAFYGVLTNTVNGLGITGGDGNGALGNLDYTWKKFLYDGTPITIFYVFRINSIQTSAGGTSFLRTGSAQNNAFVITQPVTGMSIRTYSGGTIIADNGIPSGTFTSANGNIVNLVDVGYNAASANLHRKLYLNNTLNTERKFSATPSVLDVNEPFMIQTGGSANLNSIYEIIIYKHVGKTEEQILDEKNRIYDEYLSIRYPNLSTPT